jgi:alginate O-acetyltransferase complex protein AlgI
LREYLYVPLGGNRKGPVRTYVNLILVMLLGGLWHGASWNFVIWGGIHGGMLAWERWRHQRGAKPVLPPFLRVVVTFIIVLFTWVFFRAADLPGALKYCGAMLGVGGVSENAALVGGLIYQPYYLVTMIMGAIVVWTCPQTWDWTRRITWPKVAALAAAFVVALIILATQSYNPFIYFIF